MFCEAFADSNQRLRVFDFDLYPLFEGFSECLQVTGDRLKE